MLEKEFKYYLDNQSELLKKYKGRYIVIKDHDILGDYSNELEALEDTKKNHKIGTFLIQKCTPGTIDHTETYHSRVVFT